MSASGQSTSCWWQSFFDADYIRIWGGFISAQETAHQAEALWTLLELRAGSRLLDAPCGFGRLSRPLAERGAFVTGVDYSAELLAHAEQQRGEFPESQLRYIRHDLREPLPESGFDAACNVFSSIGYGSEEDDLSILRTLCHALRPGGWLFLDTNHRDVVAAFLSRGIKPGSKLLDGTVIVEEPVFDPIAGRMETSWHWSGPRGGGMKAASLRIYSATELVKMVESAGFHFRSAYRGCSLVPYKSEGIDMGGRIGLLAQRPA